MSSKKATGRHSTSGKSKLNESLSALMDGEATEFELRRVLKECASDPAMKEKWERYHMLSAHFRGDSQFRMSAPTASLNENKLLDGIHGQLAKEGVKGFSGPRKSTASGSSQAASKQNSSNLFFRLGQGAIAASVAFTVMIGTQVLNNSNSSQSGIPELAEQSSAAVMEFNDNYSPTEFNRVPQLNSELAEVQDLNEAARDRLRRAVYQEFIGEEQESVELPVNFSVTREAQTGQ